MNISAENYTLEKGTRGTRLVLHTEWSDQLLDIYRTNKVKEMEVNYAKGFKGKDLTFLSKLSDLEALVITHRTIDDISPLNNLHNLRVLEVNTYCKTEIIFNNFPLLEECVLEWRPKAKSIISCQSLKKLFLNSLPWESTEGLSNLTNLESLSLANSKIVNIKGIATLPKLQFLGLYNLRKLEGLTGIESLLILKRLEINGCKKIHSLDPLASLPQLRELHLCDDGDILSLKPLSAMVDLEEFLFYESTNVLDGDLSLLQSLPRLRRVWFENRPHYSLKRESLHNSARKQGS